MQRRTLLKPSKSRRKQRGEEMRSEEQERSDWLCNFAQFEKVEEYFL